MADNVTIVTVEVAIVHKPDSEPAVVNGREARLVNRIFNLPDVLTVRRIDQ